MRKFHPPSGRFDGVIGGPPCQRFSPLSNIVRKKHGEDSVAPDLFPEYQRVVSAAQPDWFLCENVPAAPRPEVTGYVVRDVLVNNRDDCGGEQNRERRFSFGTRDGRTLVLEWPLPPVPMAWESTVCSSSAGRRASGPKIDANGRRQAARLVNRPLARELELQGLPPDFLEDAPFTVDGKRQAIGNGVPVGMGRMIARAVRRALGLPILSAEGEAA